MDTNNRRPTPGGDPPMGTGDWRTQMPADSRAKIVEKIMENLSMKFTPSEGAGLHELRKLAVKFEEKIFTTASSQDDYMRKISLKLVSVTKKSANPMSNSLQSNAAGNGQKQSDPGKPTSLQCSSI